MQTENKFRHSRTELNYDDLDFANFIAIGYLEKLGIIDPTENLINLIEQKIHYQISPLHRKL